jgi:DNA polymerase V
MAVIPLRQIPPSNVTALRGMHAEPCAARLPFVETPHACAGFPSPAGDYTESSLDLNQYLIRNPTATFFFTFQGDSLESLGIVDGDIGGCDRSIPATVGRVVLATVDGDFVAKVFEYDRGRPALMSRNDRITYPPIYLDKFQDVTLWGCVTSVARRI